ncbi:flavin reductase family protein [Actinomycetota bacterium]
MAAPDPSSSTPFVAQMAAADPALVVVTTAAGGVWGGCLAGFHCQTSIDPPQYVVWVSKANHTYRVVLEATHLAVHLVTPADREIAEHFGTVTGDHNDKFDGWASSPGPGGVPLLDALPHHFAGEIRAITDTRGDHVGVTISVDHVGDGGAFEVLPVSSEQHLTAGHEADERAVSPE